MVILLSFYPVSEATESIKINILSQIIQGEWPTLIAVVVGEWVTFSE